MFGVFVMNKILIICLLVLGLMTLSACSHSSNTNTNSVDTSESPKGADVSDVSNTEETAPDTHTQNIAIVKTADYVGKTVTVQGKVINTLQSEKYGISGYKIQNSNGITIDVSSKKIPQVNTIVTVTGTIYQSRFFGFVINETG
jgi:hypothetical protein